MTVEYLLGDHLGSTALTTDSAGTKVSELRYTPWGEVRYSWVDPALTTTPAYQLTKWTFTGQYSDSYINLLWYGSRHYDPELGRFISPDTIVPDPYNSQSYDRYAYANNNPLKYTDPSGHRPDDGCRTEGCNLSDYQKQLDAQKLAILRSQAEQRQCRAGDTLYCSYAQQHPVETTTFMAGGLVAPGIVEYAILGGGLAGAMDAAGAALGKAADKLFLSCLMNPACSRLFDASTEGADLMSPDEGGGIGRGSTGRGPITAAEQEAWDAVMKDPLLGAKQIPLKLNDPMWPAEEGWIKMKRIIDGVEIHFNFNQLTGEFDDFKIK